MVRKVKPLKVKDKKTETQAVSFLDDSLPIKIPKEIMSDPRKVFFIRLYFDRESPTWGNMKQSAIAAGFSEEYAHNITSLKPKWLYDYIGQQDFSDLAEGHLREVLMLPNISQAMGAFGPIFRTEEIKVEKKYKNGKTRMVNRKIKIPVMVPNTSIIKEKTLAAKLVLPAHKPELYRDKKPSVSFNFNVKSVKEKYK